MAASPSPAKTFVVPSGSVASSECSEEDSELCSGSELLEDEICTTLRLNRENLSRLLCDYSHLMKDR